MLHFNFIGHVPDAGLGFGWVGWVDWVDWVDWVGWVDFGFFVGLVAVALACSVAIFAYLQANNRKSAYQSQHHVRNSAVTLA